jgi:phenylalanyl-tRNA synthetase beta chain
VFRTTGEGQRLGIVLTGERHETSWRGETERPWDFFDLTGALGQLAFLREQDVVPLTPPVAPFGACADVFLHGKKIGIVGQLTPAVAREIGAPVPLLAAEFDLDLWRAAATAKTSVAALAKFPGSSRDIAFLAPLALPYGEVRSLIESLKETLLESVRLFDLFTDSQGEKIPSDKKSMAISLTFRSSERTLTTDEIQAAADRIKAALREKLSVDFRE